MVFKRGAGVFRERWGGFHQQGVRLVCAVLGMSGSQNAGVSSTDSDAAGVDCRSGLPEWTAGVVMRDHRTIEFRSISSELSNSFNVPRGYAISKILREGFE